MPLKVTFVVLKLALFYGIDAVPTEVDHFTEAADLRGHIGDIQTACTLLALLEQTVECLAHYVLQLVEPDLDFAFDGDWCA